MGEMDGVSSACLAFLLEKGVPGRVQENRPETYIPLAGLGELSLG